MASVVYDGVGSGGTLFAGKKFWLSVRLPLRTHYIQLIKANGGEVVASEAQANILIADPIKKKDAPVGSYSYTYIEKSVKNGTLEDLQQHMIGDPKGTVRAVGLSKPVKNTRTPFTAKDDRILSQWVFAAERRGESIAGNALYELLEKINPRHTSQSWRDRWIKILQYKPRPSMQFSADDHDLLISIYDDTLNIDEELVEEAWKAWANGHPQHTADEWRTFWTEVVLPQEAQRRARSTKTKVLSSRKPEYPTNPRRNASSQASASRVQSIEPCHTRDELEQEDRSRSPDHQKCFTRSLQEYADSEGFQVDFNPRVCGRRISLFRLWQEVKQLNEYGNLKAVDTANRWPQIASNLNFNIQYIRKAPNELRNVYIDQLFDYDTTKAAFRQYLQDVKMNGSQNVDELQMRELELYTSDANFVEEEDDIQDLNPPPTKGPRAPENASTRGEKRARSSDAVEPLSTLQVKRRKIDSVDDEGLEIPPTPEERLDPEQRQIVAGLNSDEEDDPNTFKFSSNVQRRLFRDPDNKTDKDVQAMEPETQDFHFTGDDEEAIDLTQIEPSPEDPKVATERTVKRELHDSQRLEAELSEFIEHHVSLGYPEAVVGDALHATTLETGDAASVMEELMKGRGIPSNIQGVWTSEDDQAARSGEQGVDYPRILAKHGEVRCQARKFFLEQEDEAAALLSS